MYFSGPSLIFWLIFVIPLVAGLGWIMWQDKRHRRSGLLILAVIVVVGIVYMYLKTRGL
ncbi:hypothetical protein [uncultured Mucilaginibacter sp.]|uniref:hypothetical protein n=1 Tax=uncultured Mucilaginibacter sp. TaxID=797541 RepID=UPI0025EEF4D2|nr:hypothetical protein [uncultured Mucilaginibacter sp.]